MQKKQDKSKREKPNPPKLKSAKQKNEKKESNPAFLAYVSALPTRDAERISLFFADLAQHCALSKTETALLRKDFEQALLRYAALSVPLDVALERLDVMHLGGFYVRPPSLWYTLDDAAKIYPLAMKYGQMAVFRLSVYLKEPVIPEFLQMAVNFTIKRFPSFATTVKKGFFWHYLDATKRRYEVLPETDIPCQPLHISYSASQTFRVLWYNNRISVEFFHILTDGTGGMVFLKTLVATYLRLLGGICAETDLPDIDAPPAAEEVENAFLRAEKTDTPGGFFDAPAVQMSGSLSKIKPCQVLHFRLDAAGLKQIANEQGCTVTAYILSKLFLALKAATDQLEGTFHIQVPVNMRKFYPAKTLRNFALYCGIRLPISKIQAGPALVQEIAGQLAEKASKKAMGDMMCATQKLVNALRYIPLALKTPVARSIYGFLGDGIFSTTFSNLGLVTMPSAYTTYIESMDFVLGTAITNRASCSMVTFGNIATLSIAKLTTDPSFEEALFRVLSEDGLVPEVEGSRLYEN